MNEIMDLNDINERDEDKSLLNDAKMLDESLVNKLNKEEIFKCKWCGTDWNISELVIVDGVKLCKVCNEKLLEKK